MAENLFDFGGTAFPASWRLADGATASHPGMTLRDWFAGQALAGGQLKTGGMTEHELIELFGPRYGVRSEEILSAQAYRLADAMLKARAKP